MNQYKYLTYILIALFTYNNSCVNKQIKLINIPTQTQIENANYGEEIPNYSHIIRNYLLQELDDPDSIKGLQITKPKAGWYHQKYSKGTIFGYISWVNYNSKNMMGVYNGYSNYLFLLKNKKVIKVGGIKRFLIKGKDWNYK